MYEIISTINDIVWGSLLIYFLLGVGLFFTIKSRFAQLRLFRVACRAMLNSRKTEHDNQVSPFQAFCTSLAARIGTGNIAGVAIAIYLGGPGAVFWMWLIATLGMVTSLAENILAQVYKTNNHDGTFRGGPAYYIEKALKKRWLGIVFSITLIISYGFAFNGVQANSIAAAFLIYELPSLYVGVCLAAVIAVIIWGGIHFISKVAEVLVPFMALAYFSIALIVVILNLSELPAVFSLIIKDAFGLHSAAGGGFGFMVSQAMIQGIKRGLFSNEAGMGTSPNAAAVAYSVHPVNQGLMGMFGVFIDTIVVCTATAAILILSGSFTQSSGLTGIELTQAALASQMGESGKHLIALAILFFAFTSIIANYYYGESNLRFIKESKLGIFVYRIAVVGVIVWGAVGDLPTVWAFADIFMGMMVLINITALMLLSGTVFKVLKDYDEQLASGKTPVFERKKFRDLDHTMDQDVW